MQDRHGRQAPRISIYPRHRSNSNAQSDIAQTGWGNWNAQQGVGQVGRRQNSNVQSGVDQSGWGNSNAQEQVGQHQGFYRGVPYLNRRANSNAQSGIQQSGWGNYNAQDGVGQHDFNRQPWQRRKKRWPYIAKNYEIF